LTCSTRTPPERALEQARPGREDGDLASHAAVLLDALLRGQPLRRGNQRVALAATLQFLALNGHRLDPDPPGPLAALVVGLDVGVVDVEAVADQLAPRLRPVIKSEPVVRSQPVVENEEASMPGRPVSLVMRIKKATGHGPSGKGVFARYTDRARHVVHFATEEARLLRHDYVGTEHLLLGLLYEGEGVAARALASLGISREDVRGQVEEITGVSAGPSPAHPLSFTPRAKKILELSLREALALGHHYVGTEHLLLALLRDGEGAGVRALSGLGADGTRVREQVLSLLDGETGRPGRLTAELAEVTERLHLVRGRKVAAFDAGDVDGAAAMRDQERRVLAEKRGLEILLAAEGDGRAVVAENQRLRRELNRLRTLLRQHGTEPDGPRRHADA
jgi:prophage maintenance system killer protein